MVGGSSIDEEAELQAESLARRVEYATAISRLIRTTALIILVATAVLWFLFPRYTQLIYLGGAILLVLAAATLSVSLLRRGRALPGFYVLLGGFLVTMSTAYLIAAEIRPAALLGYAMIVLLNMLFLGRTRSLVLTSIALLGLAIDVLLASLGWLPDFPSLSSTLSTALTIALTVGVSVALTMVFRTVIAGQETYFLDAGRANREVGRRAAADAAARQQLQATVEQYASYTAEVGRGRLDGRLTVTADELSPLALLGRNLNEMVVNLQEMTRGVRDTARELASATAEILAATTQQAGGAGEQSAAISQASTSLEEVRAIAEQTAGRAQGVAALARRTADVSRAGKQAVAETIGGMGEVQGTVDTIAQHILTLSERAQSIGQIIATVGELASQSNMLALNAAVEAARAGEAGKGFAVVASEVRTLAEQSRAATAQVKDILSEIQRGVNSAVMATEEGIKRASAGVKLAGEAGRAIEGLAGGVEESAQAAMQIAAAAGQQEAGMEQVAQAMAQIQTVTGQTAASARQSERAAADLNTLAGRLAELVARYRL